MSGWYDQYEYVTYIIPGGVFLLGLMWLFPWLRLQAGVTQWLQNVSSVGIFLILAFVLGNLLAGAGRLVIYGEYRQADIEAFYATNDVLKSPQYIVPPIDREPLIKQISSEFGLQASDLNLCRPGDLLTWRNVIRRIYAKVLLQQKQAAGVGNSDNAIVSPLRISQRNVGLHLDLATGFFALAFCSIFLLIVQWACPGCLMVMQVTAMPNGLRAFQIAIFVAAGFVAWHRMEYYNVIFARDLFLVYFHPAGS